MMKVSAEALDEIQRLAALGELTPKRVVEEAANESSPLHGYFEWRDDKAARAHRINQARSLIRSVRIELIVNERVLSAPKYVHDPQRGNNQGYVELTSIKSDRESALKTVRDELARVRHALRRANAVADVLNIDLSDLLGGVAEVEAKLL